jgi:hypothetical protein
MIGSFILVNHWNRVFNANVRRVQIGDTHDQVERLLGRATQRYAPQGQLIDFLRKKDLILWLLTRPSPETWVYGGWRLLRFGPAEGDVVIEFDDQGKVSRVRIPSQ